MSDHYSDRVNKLHLQGNVRAFRPLDGREGNYVEYLGKRVLNMTSNDYLGISADRNLLEEFYTDINSDNIVNTFGLGAASSRLLTGDNTMSHRLEEIISTAYKREACLLFNSGYHANIGILPAIVSKGDLILSDKLNHASIHDGQMLSRATCKRFHHKDYAQLEKILEQERDNFDRVVIVSESVFSMDGDEADLSRLVEIKKTYGCLLYIDEAHGVGVYGQLGLGKSEEYNVIEEIDLLIGTFGKAYCSIGAFLVCNNEMYDYLVNFSRSLIFTTALPPVVTSWNAFVFQRVSAMEERRTKLQELGSKLRNKLREYELSTDGSTNIVPVIIGENQRTVEVSEYLIDNGFLVFAIRPPTVPKDTARFRLSLSGTMNWSEIKEIPRLIAEGMQ